MGDPVRDIAGHATVSLREVFKGLAPAVFAGQRVGLRAYMNHRGVPGGDCVIKPVFLADRKVVATRGCEEESDGVRVGEAVGGSLYEGTGPVGEASGLTGESPGRIGRKREFGLGEPSVVGEVTRQRGFVPVCD